MHLYLPLAAFIAAFLHFHPAESVSLQTFAPCEDLSPHCPALCAACEEAEEWPETSHESFEIEQPIGLAHAPQQRRNKTDHDRQKRFAAPLNMYRGNNNRPEWLPSWIPWAYKPKQPKRDQHHGPEGGQNEQENKCDDLVHGSRQLIEAFCPQSCGRCGKSSNPIAAAKVYVTAQCTVASQKGRPAVGMALDEMPALSPQKEGLIE